MSSPGLTDWRKKRVAHPSGFLHPVTVAQIFRKVIQVFSKLNLWSKEGIFMIKISTTKAISLSVTVTYIYFKLNP